MFPLWPVYAQLTTKNYQQQHLQGNNALAAWPKATNKILNRCRPNPELTRTKLHRNSIYIESQQVPLHHPFKDLNLNQFYTFKQHITLEQYNCTNKLNF